MADGKNRNGKQKREVGKGDRARSGRRKRNVLGRLSSVIGTMLIVIIILLCSLLVLPGVFGFHMYNVLSGSMEPAIPVGSLLYVREGEPEDAKEDDIIAFYSARENAGIITHRVVKNNVVSGTIQTKGDANEKADPTPVPYENYIGQVNFCVPYVGELLTIMTSLQGKIAAACIVGLGVVMNILGNVRK